MTEVFRASNGMTVERDHNGDVLIDRWTDHMSVFMVDGSALALVEFFQHESDEQRGLWRWPENPDYVVRLEADEDGDHPAWHESTGEKFWVSIGERDHWSYRSAPELSRMHDAFFDSRAATSKPWHDAEPGEAWVVGYETSMTGFTAPLLVAGFAEEGRVFADAENTITVPITDRHIVNAHRIWPVGSDV